jgi:hypothetical protein
MPRGGLLLRDQSVHVRRRRDIRARVTEPRRNDVDRQHMIPEHLIMVTHIVS